MTTLEAALENLESAVMSLRDVASVSDTCAEIDESLGRDLRRLKVKLAEEREKCAEARRQAEVSYGWHVASAQSELATYLTKLDASLNGHGHRLVDFYDGPLEGYPVTDRSVDDILTEIKRLLTDR